MVLVLGAPVFTYHVEGFGPYLPEGASLFQIVDDPHTAARTPVGQAIVGNVAEAIAAINAAAKPAPRAMPVITAPALDEAVSGTGITEVRLMQRLTELRPKGLIVSEEAPSTRGPLHDHFPIRLDDEFMATASGGAGFALPAAVGAALAQPDKTVFCLLGDGSAMYSIQGIWTAADLKLDVRFLIVNNGGYAALEQFGALFDMVVVGSKLPGIDFVKLAEGMGVPGMRISAVDELDDAIRELFAGTSPKLLEVVVERQGAHIKKNSTSHYRESAANGCTIFANKSTDPVKKSSSPARSPGSLADTRASPIPPPPGYCRAGMPWMRPMPVRVDHSRPRVRNREDGTPSGDLDDYREVVEPDPPEEQ